jgi:hypothetical protein
MLSISIFDIDNNRFNFHNDLRDKDFYHFRLAWAFEVYRVITINKILNLLSTS